MKLNTFDLPQNWDELVSLKEKIRRVGDPSLTRLEEDLEYYYIYNQIVPHSIRMEIVKKMIGENDFKLMKNNFPYLKLIQNIPDVVHYCLWSNIGKLSKKTIDSEVVKKFPDSPFFWFENIPSIKSVPEFWHCHVFIKLK